MLNWKNGLVWYGCEDDFCNSSMEAAKNNPHCAHKFSRTSRRWVECFLEEDIAEYVHIRHIFFVSLELKSSHEIGKVSVFSTAPLLQG